MRVFTVPWLGRDEDPADASVWAITCLFVRKDHRRTGISVALLRAAIADDPAAALRTLLSVYLDPRYVVPTNARQVPERPPGYAVFHQFQCFNVVGTSYTVNDKAGRILRNHGVFT